MSKIKKKNQIKLIIESSNNGCGNIP